ncbi:AAA family ATPase [Bradyrhizobium arachidis]|uniref:AAA family ATPase n=1 Tax=Bradyrhizobium arachidis TaxID=858423 RepID=UPI002163C7AC|nr:AAA family ATPase [Bradyrhizobium arachidis]UVO29926.1 AAA family ATPase [Bradyrhizobium arachidis]
MTNISGDRYDSRREERTTTDRQAPAVPESERFDARDLTAAGYKRTAYYDYFAIKGDDREQAPLYSVWRYDHHLIPDGKQFRFGLDTGSDSLSQYKGRARVPYRWRELREAGITDPTKPVFWCEGEKDVETCIAHGLVATTAAGQVITAAIVGALAGRHVVVLVDNDTKGEENAVKAVEAFRHEAASVRVVRLPRLARREDITDWLDARFNPRHGTIEELNEIVAETLPVRAQEKLEEVTMPFFPQAIATIKKREWLYEPAYIRANVSVTAGAGARGKSTLIVAEALAMVSGKPLLGVQPSAPLRVWYVNLEDDMDELRRKFNAAMAYHELTSSDIADRLYVESGVMRDIVVAAEDQRKRAVLNNALLDQIRRIIRKRRIDVVIFDPFVSLHRVNENDNGAIDMVVKALAGIAQETNCAIMVVHHTRKPKGDAASADDTRGASALVNAARYVRVLEPMTAEEAKSFSIHESKRRLHFRTIDGKANLIPPAEKSDWYRLESFNLGNGRGFEDQGDDVGVATRYVPPVTPEQDRLANLTLADCTAAFANGAWRLDVRASPWVGDQLARHLGISATAKKADVSKAIAKAIDRGWLEVFTALVDRKPKEWVKLANGAPVATTGAAEPGGAAC